MSEREIIKETLLSVLEERALSYLVTDTACEKLEFLYRELVATNERMNITAITELQKVALLHFADSVSGAMYIPEGARIVDVGCGGGFPCLPLAIMRQDISVLAIDSTAKKLTFVSRMAKELDLRLETLACRAEDASKKGELRESFDVAISRAVARMNVLSELCLPFVRVGGSFIALKGRDALEELEEAQSGIKILGAEHRESDLFTLPGDGGERGIILCEKVSSTPAKYPRAFAQIKKSPL